METINSNNVENAQAIINSLNDNPKVKFIKKDYDLFERTDKGEKIILAEDNRQILLG